VYAGIGEVAAEGCRDLAGVDHAAFHRQFNSAVVASVTAKMHLAVARMEPEFHAKIAMLLRAALGLVGHVPPRIQALESVKPASRSSIDYGYGINLFG